MKHSRSFLLHLTSRLSEWEIANVASEAAENPVV